MTGPTSEQRLEWARLTAAATEGPWSVDAHEWRVDLDGPLWIFRAGVNADFSEPFPIDDVEQVQADAEFLAAARTALPLLLAENEQLRQANALLEQQREDAADALVTAYRVLDENTTLRQKIADALAVHSHGELLPGGVDVCDVCSLDTADPETGFWVRWPCPTAAALAESVRSDVLLDANRTLNENAAAQLAATVESVRSSRPTGDQK